jgi:hypothetical protein
MVIHLHSAAAERPHRPMGNINRRATTGVRFLVV